MLFADGLEVVFNRPLRRAQLLPFFTKLDPSHWARKLTGLGHDVRLIPPMYVKRRKSDAIDAEAICEAVTRPIEQPHLSGPI